MTEQSPFRNPLLPSVLLTGIIFGLIYVAIRAAGSLPVFQPEPMAAVPSVEHSPSATLSPTSTETPTARPTWTIRPSASPTLTSTPTASATATLYPLLPPARPLSFNYMYRLREWTPARADQMAAMLQDFPPARFSTEEQRSEPGFNEAYYYPAIAYREALLRFPEDPLVENWQWSLAYNFARNNAPQTAGYYADLILQALTAEAVDLDQLPAWFEEQEPRLMLDVLPVPAPAGYATSHILQIRGGGAATIWLLGKSTDFEVHLLSSKFDFASGLTGGVVTGDLTGDGSPEVVTFYSQTGDSHLLSNPQVYSLESLPPVELPFAASMPFDLGVEFVPDWQILQDGGQGNLLQFSARILPACPVEVTRNYRWEEGAFRLLSTEQVLLPEPDLVEYCEISVELASSLWGYEAAAKFMEEALPYWPPERTIEGRLYQPDARDEWLYRLGIAHALAGNIEQAHGFLKEAVELPSLPGGEWVERAKFFLVNYESREDLYQVCRQAPACDLRAALEAQVSMLPFDRYAFIVSDLRAAGVSVRSNGLFDFNQDGFQERWIIVLPQESQKLELWIMARGADQIHALFVDVIETPQPQFRYSDFVQEPPIIQIELGKGFKLEVLPDSGEPFLTQHNLEFQPSTYTLDTLNNAIEALFSDEDPALVLETLENLQESARFNCLNFRICDRFYYLLGLAYELNGRESDAIDTYLKLWWEHLDSPFTTMARLKLETLSWVTPAPPGTPTQTPRTYPIPIWTPGAPYPFPTMTPTSPYPNP